jgi:hypothetical protein
MSKPDYLIERGLANAGLVELTPLLIERYNKALISMGIEPTKCRIVFIDGAGWSPQVAAEKGNPWYLCDGFTNPTAIIISPDQFKRPVYMPAFSWVRSILRVVFETYHREIIDITSTDVVTLDFELGITRLEHPIDLLLISSILVKPYSGDLSERAREQQKLIDDFLEGLNCLEAESREPLIAHRKKYGDLCKRRFFMDEMHSPLARDYWTVALGGAAVIRNVDGYDLLILEDKDMYETALRGSVLKNAQILYIYDQRSVPFDMLAKAGMLVLPIESFKNDPNILQEKKEMLLALAIGECEPDFDWNAASTVKQNQIVQKNVEKIPAIFHELERFAARVRAGESVPDMSPELWFYLASPAENLPPGTREVLWILLTRKESRNILESYTRDKNRFLVWYGSLSDMAQKWVAQYLEKRYVPHVNRK